MLMEHEKIKSEAEFSSLCSMINKDFERIAIYINERDYIPKILDKRTAAGKRESLIHQKDNLIELITIVSNAGKITAPKIDI
ncbi:hypothetical protein [Klebsiella variicola]|uniref:hypothetical protein n=1 Tax=Klebsiella variicola TaxID=244366 RepID=UPI002405CE20|nr:hypothetical protein [Klebsiella variicola]MDG0490080.1 hypothetical protein [Klebsiella variicola]